MKTIILEGTKKERNKLRIKYQEMETRVYIVNIDDNNYNGNETSDDDFMTIAEEDGNVFTLDGFAYAYNTQAINFNSNDVIRFISVPLY